MRRLGIVLFASLLGWFASPNAGRADSTFTFSSVGGIQLAPDGKTLVVTLTSEGKLVYLDTLAEKEQKSVDVEFQPALVAIQGKNLFVSVKGTAKIMVLDLETAKEIKTIVLPGEPIAALGCHPSIGLLYAVNSKSDVFSVNPSDGTFVKTKAKGQYLAIDPKEGKHVYTGIQKPIREQLQIEEVDDKTVKLSVVRLNGDGSMLKYRVDKNELSLIGVNHNAASNGRAIAVSGDGKQVGMAGGGGWRVPGDPRANYSIAIFGSGDMRTLAGQVETGPYPANLAFHSKLPLGAAFREGNMKGIVVFNAKSFVQKSHFSVKEGSFNNSGYLTFAGNGAKVVYCSNNAALRKESVLSIFDLKLTPKEMESLNVGSSK